MFVTQKERCITINTNDTRKAIISQYIQINRWSLKCHFLYKKYLTFYFSLSLQKEGDKYLKKSTKVTLCDPSIIVTSENVIRGIISAIFKPSWNPKYLSTLITIPSWFIRDLSISGGPRKQLLDIKWRVKGQWMIVFKNVISSISH